MLTARRLRERQQEMALTEQRAATEREKKRAEALHRQAMAAKATEPRPVAAVQDAAPKPEQGKAFGKRRG